MALARISAKLVPIGIKARKGCDFVVRMAAFAVFLGSLCWTSSFGQTSTNASSQPPSRYLFVVETSRSMRDRAHGVFNALKQALDSGLNGQIRQGDTVGIWTFNESVYQGLFPFQKWSQATQLAFAVRLPALLEPETYQKRGRLEKLLPEMLKAMSGSEAITVILITAGEGTMRGTPFDEQINSAWKEWHDEQEGVRMPIVTVLRARLDEITEWSLTPAPRPIELPQLASEKAEKTNSLSNNASRTEQTQKQPELSKWGPEQQVAFSVWALGRTGTVATLPATSNVVQSASRAANHLPAETPKEEPLPVRASESQTPTNLTITFVPPQQELAKPAAKASMSSEEQKSGNPPESRPPPTQPATRVPAPSVAAQPPRAADGLLGEMVAHARPADSGDENKLAQGIALAAAPRSFLRENINPLVLLIVAAFGAGYCFRNWFLTESRPPGTTMSLTRVSKDE